MIDYEPNDVEGVIEEGHSEEQADLLGMLKLPEPFITCCDTLWFALITIVLLLDIIANLGLIVIYGINRHDSFLFAGLGVFIITSVLISSFYSVHLKQHVGTSRAISCFFANSPLQSGLVYHRTKHILRTGSLCCQKRKPSHLHTSKLDSNTRWLFIKLDLVQAIVNSCPQMVINMLHMFIYTEVYMVQYVALATSFSLLLLSSILHEKVRKERARNSPYGCLPMLCILFYRAFVLSARTIAFAVFTYYYGLLLLAVLLPHFLLVLGFFIFLYRQVWRVQYYKIFANSVFCILAYFPIHCEYRPEGEIVIYYIIYLVENILMVGLAYIVEPIMSYSNEHEPWSDFHKTATTLVLLFSSIGLIFMGTYYFFFHGANETISDTNLGWLAKVCEWTKRTNKQTQCPYPSTASTPTSSVSNPLCLDTPWLIAQPKRPIRENITSPIWSEAPNIYGNNRIDSSNPRNNHPSIFGPSTSIDSKSIKESNEQRRDENKTQLSYENHVCLSQDTNTDVGCENTNCQTSCVQSTSNGHIVNRM